MNLKNFIAELNRISKKVADSDNVGVVMADNIPVVEPIIIDNKIFITDINK